MDGDRVLLRISVLATCLSLVPGYWGLFHPAPVVATRAQPRGGGGPQEVPMDWMRIASLASPVAATGLLLVAVWIAFMRKSKERFVHTNGLKSSTPPFGLHIESARWYCAVFPEVSEDITAILQKQAIGKDHLELRAHQDAGWGDICMRHGGAGHHKNLEVDFTYRGSAVVPYEQRQTIPAQLIGGGIGQQKQQEDEDTAMLAAAPRLWVDYKKKAHELESLVFSKTGDEVRNIQVGPLVWNLQEVRSISLHNVIGVLRTEPVECRFTALEQVFNTQRLHDLPDLMREIMRKFTSDAQPSVDISYEDMAGNCFCRKFALSIDPYDRIVWDPQEMRIVKRAGAAS
jgi:hypothetical protein